MLIVRLVRCGNATAVNVPKRYLHAMQWKRGDFVIVEQRVTGELTVRQAQLPSARPSPNPKSTAR